MRSRLARTGTVAVGLLAIIGLTMPAARATTTGGFTFTGTMTLDGPLSDPCAGSGVTTASDANGPHLTFTHSLCPQGMLNFNVLTNTVTTTPLGTVLTLTTSPLPLNTVGNITVGNTTVDLGSRPYVHGGQTRTFALGSMVCATTTGNVLKAGKPTTHVNVGCGIAATGTITGWCGMSTAKGTGIITDGLGQTYALDFHLDDQTTVRGHWTKANGQRGLLAGVLTATAIPNAGTVPPGNSCRHLTATQFTVTGTLTVG